MEYLVVLGLSMAIVLPLWLYVNNEMNASRQELQFAYAKLAVHKIADAADLVYIQGEPSQLRVQVVFPDNIQAATVDLKEVMIKLSTPAGLTDVYAVTLGDVQGTLPTRAGPVVLLIKSEGTFVNITEGG
ncbi:hypothetical protein KJ765_01005 [Candidatus Micrarchaeota archaeon]|nr:hypothetical protein [Candidatus Micrarchaeota archaeon]